MRVSPFALLLGCACATSPAPAPRSEGSPKEPAEALPAAEEKKQANAPEQFKAELEEISALRGLAPARPVTGLRVTRDALREHLEQTFEQNVPEKEQSGTEEMLVALADLPRDFHFKETWLSLMQSELAGLYDPKEDVLFVVDGLEQTLDRATLLHELVHALQDQRFDLDRLTAAGDDRGDEKSAISALAEGDATSVMFDSLLRPEGKTALDIPPGIIETQLALSGAGAPKNVPQLIIRSMIAPYIDGFAFVHALRARGGFAEVDRVWSHLPRSTEQVLHLDKYDADERPVSVPLPAPPESGFELTFHDTWGEQSLRLLLEEWVDRKTAGAAAAGWGGDRIAAFSRGSERAVAGVWVMDTTKDASELVSALSARRGPGKALARGETSFCLLGKNQLSLAVASSGAKVVAAAGPYERTQTEPLSCEASRRWAQSLVRATP